MQVFYLKCFSIKLDIWVTTWEALKVKVALFPPLPNATPLVSG